MGVQLTVQLFCLLPAHYLDLFCHCLPGPQPTRQYSFILMGSTNQDSRNGTLEDQFCLPQFLLCGQNCYSINNIESGPKNKLFDETIYLLLVLRNVNVIQSLTGLKTKRRGQEYEKMQENKGRGQQLEIKIVKERYKL